MKGIVLYKSKYGASKKYAEWIAESCGFALAELSKVKLQELADYDVLVLGGGLYASGIAGLAFLKKHFAALKNKRIYLFCVGASPYEEKAIQEIKARNLKGDFSHLLLFYCRGAWDLQAMNTLDRGLCKLLRKAVAKKDPATYEVWEKALMAAGEEACDWTDRKYLEPLLETLQNGANS